MDTKLTLKLDKDVIEQTKQYARQKQQSLSALVERYFRFLVDREYAREMPDISPTVQQLSGILDAGDEQQLRDDYTDYLLTKYQL